MHGDYIGYVVFVHDLGHIHYENNTLLQWQNDVDLSKIEY